jgi:hypothetical protein
MRAFTIEILRMLATFEGLELTDQELAALLPLIVTARSMMEPVRDALPGDIEPASQYRIL